ncbi:SCP-like protein [Ancylostoma ceylanicum]|uniref:SCP-like protein n=1 Tax=Ancylostoma ceylanicum TaxID=53326 RepID=A0A0D6M1E1_9BILA|nr:SCP-like protein [Ancylostoma ceylanicum]
MGSAVAIIAVLFVGAVGAAPGLGLLSGTGGTEEYQCWNFKSTDEIRHQYLITVNNLRRKIAEGVAENKQGNCPQGKNIQKLLAHGKATRIGCAQKNCNGHLYMACMVYEKTPEFGQPIYELGKGCSSPNDCTTYVGSKCRENLCVGGHIDPQKVPETTTAATTTKKTTTSKTTAATPQTSRPPVTTQPGPTSSTHFPIVNKKCGPAFDKISNDFMRDDFLNLHNGYRSEVAQGRLTMGDGKKARVANKMRKLEYDCPLEMSAYKIAKLCDDSMSNENFAENRMKLPNSIEFTNAPKKAMEAWYKEIKTGHMNQATGSQNLLLPTLNITNYAKMIWDSHEKVGCAVFQCKTTKNVVCHYSPK